MFKIITNKRYDELEARTVDLAGIAKDLYDENKELKNKNERIENNNFMLARENQKLTRKLKEIAELTTCNTYNNEKAVYDKIKELCKKYDEGIEKYGRN